LEWTSYLGSLVLALVRVSGMVVFAPFFSSTALPARTKAVFAGAIAFLLAPLIATLPRAHAELSCFALLGEVAVGMVYGLTLALLNEMMLFAGQVLGIQFSFSMVNLLDPTSSIQTSLMSDLLQILGTLVVLAAGLDRILLASMMRSFRVVPPGTFSMSTVTAIAIVRAAGGIFLAAVELAAPVLAATMLIEVAIALLGKLSPQLPVPALSVPLKTLTGFAVLVASCAVWPRFIEGHFSGLLDLAERLMSAAPAVAGSGWGG
jgi:flagellar biosynthetic protein FliR